MTVHARVKSRRKKFVLAATAMLMAIAATLGVSTTAQASVSSNQTTTVWYNLPAEAGSTATIQYSTFLASLRAAASVTSSDGQQQTQNNSDGLIQVQLGADDDQGNWRTVDLWIQPQNLYVLGFQPQEATRASVFNDAALVRNPGTNPSLGYFNIGFGGDYNSLAAAAGRDRSTMPISYNDIRGSILQLATVGTSAFGTTNSQATARSLMLLIQMTSEAARFNDVEGTFRSAVGSYTSFDNGLPDSEQHLENNWGTLSTFFYRLGQGGGAVAVPNITDVGLVTTRDQVRRYVRVLLGATAGKVGYNGGTQQY